MELTEVRGSWKKNPFQMGGMDIFLELYTVIWIIIADLLTVLWNIGKVSKRTCWASLYSILALTAVVWVLRMFFLASSSFQSYWYLQKIYYIKTLQSLQINFFFGSIEITTSIQMSPLSTCLSCNFLRVWKQRYCLTAL